MGCDISPLPLIHHGNQQILIFEKINPHTFRSVIQHIPSTDVFEKEKIQEILSEIKLLKEKNQKNSIKRNGEGFPDLQNRNRLKKI